ncbi:hypothetical protein AB4144_64900, partial [Rhizobiaceae sp. 2RAB30]
MQEIELMATRSYSAFACARYAALAEKPEEEKRLFEMAFRLGKDYINFVQIEGTQGRQKFANIPGGFADRL